MVSILYLGYRYILVHCTHDYLIHATKCSMYKYHIMHNGAFEWENCTEGQQNDLDRFNVKKYQYSWHIDPQSPNSHKFHFAMSCFRAMSQFCEKYTDQPLHDLTCSRLKSTHMHTTYRTPPSLIFSTVSLYNESFLSYATF